MTYYTSTFATPLGAFSVAVDETGAVVGTAFGRIDVLRTRVGAGDFRRDETRSAEVRRQIGAYFEGAEASFALRIAARGTPFQQAVWAALRQIPVGQTRSYGELAAELGRPSAARAVGRANATNPVCLIVPCHRVIGADGSLTGFAFGEELKRRLLAHEQRFVASRAA